MTNVVPIPTPRPEKRKRLGRVAWKRLRDRVCVAGECLGCRYWFGQHGLEAHHVLGRDLGGDDVEENLVPLCHDCHMTYEDRGHRWREIAGRVRRHLEASHVHLLYLVKKRGGVDQARSFIDRYYPEPTREGDRDVA